MLEVYSRLILIDNVETHYLESGSGPDLVLLHSGEFGGCAELSWEHNIAAFAEHFHVVAPDWLGYGRTAKLFSFDDMWQRRVDHIAGLLRTLCIGPAHFVGNSMGGTVLLGVAAAAEPAWRLRKVVVVAGGGTVPENAGRDVLNSYDGSREHMRRIIEVMFANPDIRNDEAYLDRRHRLSREPGAWESTAAIRLRAPWRERRRMPQADDYSRVAVPVLLVTGAKDVLRAPDFGPVLQRSVPGSLLHVVQDAGHCPNIDAPAEFNRVVLDFLLRTPGEA